MTKKCYRCGDQVESRDNIAGWGFLGGFVTSVIERTEARRIRVRATTVQYRERGSWPIVTDEENAAVPLLLAGAHGLPRRRQAEGVAAMNGPTCLRAYGIRCNAPLDCRHYYCPRRPQ